MLLDLEVVGQWFKNEPDSAWFFDEIIFDDEAKVAFEGLPLDLEVFDHSARVKTSEHNFAYLPCHYFLYAVKVKPLVELMAKYLRLSDKVVGTFSQKSKTKDFHDLVHQLSPNHSETNALDSYSRDNFYNVFKDDGKRFNAKKPINLSNNKIRRNVDFFGSVILKVLPVPDDSSGILGKLLYAFSQSPDAYQVLVEKYSVRLPYLLRALSGDELLYMLMTTLSSVNKLDNVFSNTTGRLEEWGGITDAFLLNSTAVSGNTSYLDNPIDYSDVLKKFIYIKKGMLDEQGTFDKVSELISELWPNMSIHKSGGEFLFRSTAGSYVNGPVFEGATNKIFYGAPGTGKSHKILTEECQDAEKVVTVFHPDTQYSDFVGALKPMMEKDGNGNSVVTYQFRPGPFTNALVKAKSQPDKHICLVIEEINRAPAAAVFGELFQLLDRNENGGSAYKIDAADPDMLMYINEQFRAAGTSEIAQLEIPANLSIFATMNSSDQAVMPLDTAFKRRWSFEYLEIDFTNPAVPKTAIELRTKNGLFSIEWPALAEIINDELSEKGITEDRLIGPFFLNPKELGNSTLAKNAINGKLFVYLWDDVLRHLGHHNVFSSAYKTFGKLSRAFIKNEAVFSRQIEDKIEVKGTKIEVVEASQDGTE